MIHHLYLHLLNQHRVVVCNSYKIAACCDPKRMHRQQFMMKAPPPSKWVPREKAPAPALPSHHHSSPVKSPPADDDDPSIHSYDSRARRDEDDNNDDESDDNDSIHSYDDDSPPHEQEGDDDDPSGSGSVTEMDEEDEAVVEEGSSDRHSHSYDSSDDDDHHPHGHSDTRSPLAAHREDSPGVVSDEDDLSDYDEEASYDDAERLDEEEEEEQFDENEDSFFCSHDSSQPRDEHSFDDDNQSYDDMDVDDERTTEEHVAEPDDDESSYQSGDGDHQSYDPEQNPPVSSDDDRSPSHPEEEEEDDRSYDSDDDEDRSYRHDEEYDVHDDDDHDDDRSFPDVEEESIQLVDDDDGPDHPRDDRSYGSGEEDDDRSYRNGEKDDDDDDNQSYYSNDDDNDENSKSQHGNEDDHPSYMSGDEGSIQLENSARDDPQDDRSYYSGEDDDRSYRSGEGDDQSYRSGEDDDRSYRGEDDDRSYRSGEEDNRSYRSGQGDDQSYRSGEDDDRSYRSGEDDDRSYCSGEEDDRSYRSGEEDDRSYRSGEGDDQSYRSGEEDNRSYRSGQGDDQSYRSGEDDDRSYRSGEDDDRSYCSGEEDDRSYRSGEEDDNQSYYNNDDEIHHTSPRDHDDDDDRSYYSDDNDQQSTHNDDEFNSFGSDRDDADQVSNASGVDDDGKSYNHDEPTSTSRGVNRVYSNESMPMIELDEISDSEHEEEHIERSNSRQRHDTFYHEEPSFTSLPMDQSESTGTSHLETSRRQESVNQPALAPYQANVIEPRPTGANKPSLYSNENRSIESFNEDDDDGTDHTASLNDFDSFAYDKSTTSLLRESGHKRSNVGVQCIVMSEDASVVSALPLDSNSPNRSPKAQLMEGDTRKTPSTQQNNIISQQGSIPSETSESEEVSLGSFGGDDTVELSKRENQQHGSTSEDNDGSLVESESDSVGPSLQLAKPKAYNGYTREQMLRLIQKEQAAESSQRKKRSRRKMNPVVEFTITVHNAVITGEKERELEAADIAQTEDDKMPTSTRLLYAFEALAGIFLQLSDELELLKTFAVGKVSPAIETLESLLAFTEPLSDAIQKLEPILIAHVTAEIDEELDDFLYGMNLIIDLLCELAHRSGEKQVWNARINTAFVTLLELLARDTLEVCCIFDDIDTPEYELTDMIHDAWDATGHVEEIKSLMDMDDLFEFRQLCYEVILSTDQWCPDNKILMDICGIDAMSVDEQPERDDDEIMASPPEAALQILEKIHGEPLPRTSTLASVIRRLLPADAISDPVMTENVGRIRNSVRNPIGIPPSSLVTITSTPESFDDPDSLGVAGVGKTTLAAMVASHDDILRFYNDGIAWIYVGEIELNYNRYVQCLQDLLSQLEVDEDEEPLFPELLHVPGESLTMRKRREEGFMIYLRETIVEFLRYRNVLIILDDVCFEPDLDWFDFAPAPPDDDEDLEDEGTYAILVTSRRRNLLPPADTVEVDMLDEAEGIRLLVGESGDIAEAVDVDAEVTKSVIRECAGHSLTIKSVGRWLNLKHATAEPSEIVQKTHKDVLCSMEKILKNELQDGNDMVYEILSMSLCPAINGEPTAIIKFCFAAFVRVFCQRKHISDFALADSTPIVPMASTELLFESLLDLEEDSLLKEGSIFYGQKKEAAKLIPEVLASLGVFKVIITYAEAPEDSSEDEEEDEKYLQIMHRIQQEYGEHLYDDDPTLTELTKDGERRWNKAFAKSFNAREVDWDTQTPDAGLDYALEMLPSHMMRGGLLTDTVKLLRNEKFIRGRLSALGRENGSRRHIKDSELLFDLLAAKRASGQKKLDPKGSIRLAYDTLGRLLKMGEEEFIEEEGSPEAVEVGRCHFEIGFSLAERRCWEGAITHWELSQEFLVVSLGMVELVAGLLYNIAIVYAELQDYDMALSSLKQCLRIRAAIHGEEHILYAQTIQKIGDIFLAMSDYHEAIESYDWALDVMHIEPSHYRINIGDILEQIGSIHYIKGEIEDSLQSYQDALRSKQIDLGEDHPELAQIFHHIGNCLSNLGKTDEAIAHLEEAIRLKQLDSSGGYERDSDILTIEGILNNLNFRQKEGLECYEKALQILVTKVPHKKEKVAALLHLVGCVYLMSGEHKKALKLFEESLYARRKVLGFVHLDVASTLFNMAFLHQSRNRLDKALKCLEECLRIRQLRLPDSEKVAVTHEKIGNLARGIGKTKKAENAFNDALRIRKLIHGNSHEAVATVLQELGDLMDDLGEYENAMKHYVEALEIRENRLGPDDLAVAETYYSMGFTLQNNGALDRALQCLEESLSIRKFQLGDDSKEVGDTLNMMGFLQAKRGEWDDALALLWDALRIRKLQEDNIKVSETLNNIGNVHREKQEYDLSIECYEECLRIRRAELGDGHEKVADALIALGNVQSDLEYNEEAMDSFKEGSWSSLASLFLLPNINF